MVAVCWACKASVLLFRSELARRCVAEETKKAKMMMIPNQKKKQDVDAMVWTVAANQPPGGE